MSNAETKIDNLLRDFAQHTLEVQDWEWVGEGGINELRDKILQCIEGNEPPKVSGSKPKPSIK